MSWLESQIYRLFSDRLFWLVFTSVVLLSMQGLTTVYLRFVAQEPGPRRYRLSVLGRSFAWLGWLLALSALLMLI